MAVIEAISTTYLEANAANVTFSSIPQTYEHLQLRYTLALNATVNSYQRLWLGDGSVDTGTNYSNHYMTGHDSTVAASSDTGGTNGIYLGNAVGEIDRSWAAVTIVDILDYVNTDKNTSVMINTWAGGLNANADYVYFASGLWDSTAAVDTIKIDNRYASNFLRGSEFTLYGLNSS